LRFKVKQKFKFLGTLIEILTEKLKDEKKLNESNLKVSEYSLNLLTIFGGDAENNLSIQTFKAFHAVIILIFLFL
jgi:hypothetical protein